MFTDHDRKVAFSVQFGESYQLFAAAENQYGFTVTDLIDVQAPAKVKGRRPDKPVFTKLIDNAADSTMRFNFSGISSNTETLRLQILDVTAWEESSFWTVLGDFKVPSAGKGRVVTPYVSGHSYQAILEATNDSGVRTSDTFRFSMP